MNKRYECVLDTSFLAELLTQYDFAYPLMELSERGIFTQKVTKILNTIIKNPDIGGRIVASSTAFVELLNKFSVISNGRFDKNKVKNFLKQPPEWFIVEPLDIDTCKEYINIPKESIGNQKMELIDTFHIATAMQRGVGTYLATTDHKIWELNYKSLHIELIK